MGAFSTKALLAFLMAFNLSSITGSQLWPAGRYGLPKAKSGCPSTRGFAWQIGWRLQDTEDLSPNNQHSVGFHLDASVSKSELKRHFCMKTDISSDSGRSSWPAGQYCIYRKGKTCPSGLSSGWIKWDDEDLRNKNGKGGTLPDGIYDHNTVIYFCCRSDGRKTVPISLPTEKSFFLIAQGSATCQQVRYMIARTEWIRFDTEDINNGDGFGGSYPYGAGIKDHTMHYCYYISCAYKLSGQNSGTITSPNYPLAYPNGQYCSWQITVPSGLQVSLVFTLFLLQSGSDVDTVQIFDGSNATAPSLGVFSSLRTPPSTGIVSTSNSMFVLFKSDASNNNQGFAANYNSGVFTTPRPSTPPTNATTTSSSTVTSQTSSVTSTTEHRVTTTAVTQASTTVTNPVTTATESSGNTTTSPYTTETGGTPSTRVPTEGTQPSRKPTEGSVTSVTPTEGVPATDEPAANGSSHAYRKAVESSGPDAVVISVPVVVLFIIFVLVLLLLLAYRRRRTRYGGEPDKNHLVFFSSDGRSPHVDVSIDNPVYDVAPNTPSKEINENGVNPIYQSNEDYSINPFSETTNPLYDSNTNGDILATNPLYDSAAVNDDIPDVYAVPNKDNVPTMHLGMNDDVMAYENQLYDTRMLGIDQSNESTA